MSDTGIVRAPNCGCILMLFVNDEQTDKSTLADAAKYVKQRCSLEYVSNEKFRKMQDDKRVPFGCKRGMKFKDCARRPEC